MNKGTEELLSEMKAAAEKANTDAEHNDWGYDTDAFHDVATPDNVLALIAALEQAQKESKVQRDTIANLTELWNEQRLRIAELEAASVKSVRLPGRGGVESSTVQSIKDWSDGWAAYREEAIKAILAAGGSVEGSD